MPSSPTEAAAPAALPLSPPIEPAESLGFERRGWLKRLLPTTMFGRSLLLMIMPLALVQVIATWIFYDRHWEAVSYRFSSDVAGDVAMMIETMQTAGAAEPLDRLFARAGRSSELAFVWRPGAALPTADRGDGASLVKQLQHAMIDRVGRPFAIDAESSPGRVLIAVQLADGVLGVSVPLSRLYTPTTYIFILWMVGSALVLLAIATLFLRNQIRSLRRLAAAAESLGKGRPVPFIKLEGALEVRQAAIAFMRMRDRIQRQLYQRTEMLAGVSHDLRTPLTRMRLALEFLGDDAPVAELRSDVAEMEQMVNGYLDFARGEGTEAPVETDLCALIEDLAAAMRHDETPIALDLPEDCTMPVRPQAMRRCLGNLLANACRYGRHVWLSTRPAPDGIDIVVDDDGPGIPEAERERVFLPFIRLEASRNPATGGVGLGLAIARDIARSHGGDIKLETSPHGGLRARVHLPR